MNITLNKGFDKNQIPYSEIEMGFDDVRINIRRYPRRTFINYFNDYRGSMTNMDKCENEMFTLWEHLDPVSKKCRVHLTQKEKMHVQQAYRSSVMQKGDGSRA